MRDIFLVYFSHSRATTTKTTIIECFGCMIINSLAYMRQAYKNIISITVIKI